MEEGLFEGGHLVVECFTGWVGGGDGVCWLELHKLQLCFLCKISGADTWEKFPGVSVS